MTISDGRTSLKKIAFQIGERIFRFAINPDSYSHAKPHRTTAIKTKSRIVIEDFQSDIPTITIGGSTGFNPTGQEKDRGINKIREMKGYLEEYAKMGGNGRTSSEDFYFHNFTNDESYVVHLAPEGVTYTQDVTSPLTYRYEIKFVVLRKSTEPADEDVVSPEIGNRYPSIGLKDAAYQPIVDNNGIPMPSPIVDNNGIPMPSPVLGNSPANGNSGSSSGNSNVYSNGSSSGLGSGSQQYTSAGTQPINPQAPSSQSYFQGVTGLGYSVGYYGRRYQV